LEKAVHFEITRQNSLHSRGIPIVQETRHWDDKRKITISSRSKEEELDYRYFLEGDIPWIKIGKEVQEKLKSEMPESISSKKERYVTKYGIPDQVAEVLSSDKFYSDLFDKSQTGNNAKEIANIITTDLMGLVDTREKREESKLQPSHLKDLADEIQSGKLTRSSAKNALYEIVKNGKELSQIVSELDLGNVSDEDELLKIIKQIISEEPQAVEQAKSNPQTINFLVGKVMQKTKGKADPKLTLDLLKKEIG
jgi:aspartyl-tRNA(Asn)/glutamyl-tRNA(Gln) amidotransferase subunit B